MCGETSRVVPNEFGPWSSARFFQPFFDLKQVSVLSRGDPVVRLLDVMPLQPLDEGFQFLRRAGERRHERFGPLQLGNVHP